MPRKGMSLEEISVSSDTILLDSSILLGTYECLSNANRTKIYCAEESLSYFTRKIDIISNILLTEKIYSELSNFSFISKYPKKDFKRDEQNRAYIEIIFQKDKQKFLEKMALQGNILKLSKNELKKYNKIHSKYFQKKKRYHLSEPDYDLAVSALICGQEGEKTSIISNDNGIKKIWHDFLDLENFGENLKFFNHVSLGNFKKLK